MSTVKSAKPPLTVKSAKAPPSIEPIPAAEAPPALSAPDPSICAGDRIALILWVSCALLMAGLLLVDLVRSLVRL